MKSQDAADIIPTRVEAGGYWRPPLAQGAMYTLLPMLPPRAYHVLRHDVGDCRALCERALIELVATHGPVRSGYAVMWHRHWTRPKLPV